MKTFHKDFSELVFVRRFDLICTSRGCISTGHAAENWNILCMHHEPEYAEIRKCMPGTFNLKLKDPAMYTPPADSELKKWAKSKADFRQSDGNYVSPYARVVNIQGHSLEARIYRGGKGDDHLELLSKVRIRDLKGIADSNELIVCIEEFRSS